MTVVTGSLKEFVGQTSASIVLLTFLVLSEYVYQTLAYTAAVKRNFEVS